MITIRNINRKNLEVHSPSLFIHGTLPSGTYILLGCFRCIGASGSNSMMFYFANKLDFVCKALKTRSHRYFDTTVRMLSYNLEIGYGNDYMQAFGLLSRYCKENSIYIINIDHLLHRKSKQYVVSIENSLIQYTLCNSIDTYKVRVPTRKYDDTYSLMDIGMSMDDKACDYQIRPEGEVNTEIEKIALKQSLMGSDTNIKVFGDKVIYQVGDPLSLLNIADYMVGDYDLQTIRDRSVLELYKNIELKSVKIAGIYFKGKQNTIAFCNVSLINRCKFKNLHIEIQDGLEIKNCIFEHCTIRVKSIQSIIECVFEDCDIHVENCEYDMNMCIISGKLEVENKPKFILINIKNDTNKPVNILLHFSLSSEEFKIPNVGRTKLENKRVQISLIGDNKELDDIHEKIGAVITDINKKNKWKGIKLIDNKFKINKF